MDGIGRYIKNDHIEEIPKELKDFLKSKITIPNLKSFSEKLKEEIQTEDFNLDLRMIII